MNCPVCNVALTMTERSGVEIDYCQRCRGVWLDRGELDKIIERAAVGTPNYPTDQQQYNQPNPPPNQPNTQYNQPNTQYNQPNTQYNPPTQHDNRGHHDNQHQYKQHDDYKYKKKKKESFLGELF